LADEPGELFVVDHRRRIFALEHIGDLRTRKGRVQVQRACTALCAGDGRLDEATVVTAHDRNARVFVDAGVGERRGKRGRARIDVAESLSATVVDDRGAVREASRATE